MQCEENFDRILRTLGVKKWGVLVKKKRGSRRELEFRHILGTFSRPISNFDRNWGGKDEGSLGWKSEGFFGQKKRGSRQELEFRHFLVKRIEGGELEFRKLPTPGPRQRMEFTVEKKLIEDFHFFWQTRFSWCNFSIFWSFSVKFPEYIPQNVLSVFLWIFWEVSLLPRSIQCWWNTAVLKIEKGDPEHLRFHHKNTTQDFSNKINPEHLRFSS